MHNVECSKCGNSIRVTNLQFRRNKSFYCSKLCQNGTMESRFWSKVNKTNNIKDCWEWNASSRTEKKYGAFNFNGKLIDAHRLSWMMSNNRYNLTPLDFICHKCDNPSCVNPNHLFLGNHSINMKDAYSKGRLKVPLSEEYRFKIGHIPLNKEISNELVLQINREYEIFKVSISKLCKFHNVSYQTLRDSRRKDRRTYKNLDI